jgi:TPR repeat protein
MLGLAYVRGEGVQKDFAKGAALFIKSCAAGDAPGCLQLGFAMREGRGIAKDQTRATELFDQACKKGLRAACQELTPR